MKLAAIEALDRIAVRAWPALEQIDQGGWILRAAKGVTGRSNSCWPLGLSGDATLDQRIDAVEAFYAARGLPPRFYVSPAAKPSLGALEAALDARGYATSVPTHIMIAETGVALARAKVRRDVTLAEKTDAAMRDVLLAGTPSHDEALGRLALLERTPPPGRYATAWDGGRPMAVGRVGLDADSGQAGIFAMRTAATARRQGFARAVLGSLIAWAASAGALGLYLQVEDGNDGAIALYRDHGFATAYQYRYRILGGEEDKHD